MNGRQETNTPSFGGDLLDGTDWVEVKTWLSKSDERVRETHAYLNGQMVHAEGEFTSRSGAKAQYPGGFGVAAEDINCRCTVKYTLMKKDEFLAQGGILPENEKGLTSGDEDGIIKTDNKSVRMWYHDKIKNIPNEIEQGISEEEKAKKAFELRNQYRSEARKRMADTDALSKLERDHPNPTFEQLVESKMLRKSMTREEAIQDVYETATKSNPEYDKLVGL